MTHSKIYKTGATEEKIFKIHKILVRAINTLANLLTNSQMARTPGREFLTILFPEQIFNSGEKTHYI